MSILSNNKSFIVPAMRGSRGPNKNEELLNENSK